MEVEKITKKIRRELIAGNRLLGVATGSGMSASQVQKGGADFILALNSGRFRVRGRSSLAGFLPFENSNQEVLNFATKEILPLLQHTPIIFGLNATDPTIDLVNFIGTIKANGFSGVNNYPTVGLLDGQFSEALEESGCSYQLEVEAIKLAHDQKLFTIAFVFNQEQARQMTDVGADVICFHCGLTRGGKLGAKKVLSLANVIASANEIVKVSREIRPNVITMIYGGPVSSLIDIRYIYNQIPGLNGYIGGSTFDRITPEELIIQKAKEFKSPKDSQDTSLMSQMLDGIDKHYDYVVFVEKYIEQNYHEGIYLEDLAQVAHVTSSYLSTLFKKKTGASFTEHLIKFRLNKAIELMAKPQRLSFKEIAFLVGYPDYAQFNKIFKKYMGTSPSEYSNARTKE